MESLSNPNARVAIVHDILFEYGGSERVLEALLSIYPNSRMITLYMNPYNKIIQKKFKKYSPHTLGLEIFGKPMTTRFMFHVMKFVGPLYFYFLNLSGYTLVISSSHAFNAKMVRKPIGAVHMCYLYSPPRHLYAELNSSCVMNKIISFPLVKTIMHFFQILDTKAARHPDIIIAPSKEVQSRVRRYYNRESTVIYPPVHIPKMQNNDPKEKKYYLFFSRLVGQKGIELAVETCTKYLLPLTVIGEGYLRKAVQKTAGKTIRFLGYVPEEILSRVFAEAKALLFCAQNEDFGIVPVEAMAHGVPVIAYDHGAIRETVVEGKTGIFFRTYTPEGLFKAMKKLETSPISSRACYKQAQRFSEARFVRSIKKII